MNAFMYEAPGDRMNRLGNLGARIIMNVTRNFALADELAVVFSPIGL